MSNHEPRGRRWQRLPHVVKWAASSGMATALSAALLVGCGGDGGGGDGGTGPASGIEVSLDPGSLTLAPGASGTATVTVRRSGGASGSVELELTGAPNGVTASFEPRRLRGDAETSTLTVAVGDGVAEGEYSLQVRASGTEVGEESKRLSLAVGGAPATGFRGTLTLAGGAIWPEVVVDLDAASGRVAPRLTGIDPHGASNGETVFLTPLGGGGYPDFGVVVADAQGAIGAPLYICPSFNFVDNRVCHTPKLSPDSRLVAFGAYASSSADQYTLASYVMVRDRAGVELARFEGFGYPDWTPDGRLVMMGTAARNGGVWVADAALGAVTRVDHDEVGTPAEMPAVSPDGRRVAFVWDRRVPSQVNKELWTLTLDERAELTQLSRPGDWIAAAAWSPDGTALATLPGGVGVPEKALLLFRPGGEYSFVLHPLTSYPYGPISWH